MEETSIKLNRNIFCLQLLVFFPVIFLFAVGGLYIYSFRLENDLDKIFIIIGFIIELCLMFCVAYSNDKTLVLSDNSIELRRKNKVLNVFPVDSIKKFVCNDKKKSIKVLTHNGTEGFLLNYFWVKSLGELNYFNVKSELCKMYPTKTESLKDESINSFFESGEIPKQVTQRYKSGVCIIVILLIFEFILSILPLGMTILSVLWGVASLALIILKFIVGVLNLI